MNTNASASLSTNTNASASPDKRERTARQWVDDPAATAADLYALTLPDEADWRDERDPILLYR
jgi:hypothetical protein